MGHAKKEIEIRASPQQVFAYMDDIRNIGWHMEGKRSARLLGSKLSLDRLSEDSFGVGATYRWHGRIAGLELDFTEVVTKWVENVEKRWHTIGDPKLIIMADYEMRLALSPQDGGTKVTLEIIYELPQSWHGKILGKLLAGWYSEWCLRRACEDAKRALEVNSH